MKKFKYLYIGVLSAILSGTFTSCEDYLDVNKNPNYPDESQVTVTTLLPSAFTGSCRNGVFVPTLRFYVVTALHAESVIQPIYHAGQLCDDFFQRPPSVENSVRGRFA